MTRKTQTANPLFIWERLEYPIRLAWYHFKLGIGLEPKSDKNFLPHDFAMRLESGKLPSDTRFTIAGRQDGVGMQAMARLSGVHFADVFGAIYVDTPFDIVDHVTNRDFGSTEAWEKLLNIGQGEVSIAGHDDKVIDYADFLAGRKKLKPDSILRLQQCFWLYRRHPDSLDRSVHLFHERYNWPKRSSTTLSIAVHIRRGDVGKKRNALRYTSNDRVMRAIAGVESVLQQLGRPYEVTVHSQGRPEEFTEFTARGYTLNLEEDALIAMKHFVESDIFVMSKSSLSYLAALYNRGIKLYEPTFNPCLPSWIARKANGDFDKTRLYAALNDRVKD